MGLVDCPLYRAPCSMRNVWPSASLLEGADCGYNVAKNLLLKVFVNVPITQSHCMMLVKEKIVSKVLIGNCSY